MVGRQTDCNGNQHCGRSQNGSGTEVPRARWGGSFDFAREHNTFAPRAAQEALPRIRQWPRHYGREFLLERSVGLRQVLSDQCSQLAIGRAALATLLDVSLKLNIFRAVQ